ncbi:MAG TPA: O-antigen ligase family protein [Sphingomicrobium sp.]|nr:O-antigen ligase family protein [Sphingomicrobium sp.]
MIGTRIAALAVPSYLLLALLLGGSTRGIWGNMGLQLLAIALLAWTALSGARQELPSGARPLALIIAAGLVLVVLQLVPLPPAVWSSLPGREAVAEGYAVLGKPLPWLPLSLNPYGSLASALALLPPVAVAAVVLTRPQREAWLAAALLAGACLGVGLGALQIASAGPGKSDVFLYEITNGGAVGFFANRNHMGTLLLAGLPFAIALLGSALQARERSRSAGSAALVGAVVLLLLAGIVLNGSTAVLLLGAPVLGFSLLLLPMPRRWRRILAFAALLVLIVSAVAVTAMPRGGSESDGDMSLLSRLELWNAGAPLAGDFIPLGSGLGSFEHAFHLYETPAETTRTYVNHVHNDYLELFIELGIPGALLIIAFLAWWSRQLVSLWRSPLASRLTRAATIVSAAILAQSLVDYPLRTAAIASLFGLCLGLMARSGGQREPGQQGAGGPRHVVIG